MMLITVGRTGNTIGFVFPWADNMQGERVRKKDLLTALFDIHLPFHYLQCGAMTSHGGICWMSEGYTQTTLCALSLKGQLSQLY